MAARSPCRARTRPARRHLGPPVGGLRAVPRGTQKQERSTPAVLRWRCAPRRRINPWPDQARSSWTKQGRGPSRIAPVIFCSTTASARARRRSGLSAGCRHQGIDSASDGTSGHHSRTRLDPCWGQQQRYGAGLDRQPVSSEGGTRTVVEPSGQDRQAGRRLRPGQGATAHGRAGAGFPRSNSRSRPGAWTAPDLVAARRLAEHLRRLTGPAGAFSTTARPLPHRPGADGPRPLASCGRMISPPVRREVHKSGTFR